MHEVRLHTALRIKANLSWLLPLGSRPNRTRDVAKSTHVEHFFCQLLAPVDQAYLNHAFTAHVWGGHRVLLIEFFWQALVEPYPLGWRTLLVAAFLLAGAIAIGLFSRRSIRILRGLFAIRRLGDGEASLLDASSAQQKSDRGEDAIARFDQALVSNPHSLEALRGRGIFRSQMGEYDLAMQDFHMWVLHAPDNGDAYFHRGDTWQKLDLIGLAISDYRSALKCNPSHEAARGALAELMRKSTADRPKTIFSLAALFAAHGPADGPQPSKSDLAASAVQPPDGLHG